jgi:peptide/nickel transport system ATP-binding protein
VSHQHQHPGQEGAREILRISHLATHYGLPDSRVLRSVNDVSLVVRSHETIALVGESGCGKSTTALSIMRLVKRPGFIRSGSIQFEGVELTTLSEPSMRRLRGGELAMIFQNPTTYLNPIMRIGSQLAESAQLHLGLSRSVAWKRAVEMLDSVRIPNSAAVSRNYPHELSGGMNQRVLIALALICEPRLLILDEPTTALDVTIQREVIDLIREMRDRTGMAMIFITHDLGLVAELCDRAYVMYAGNVVEHGRTVDIFAQPTHPYTRGLLRSVRSLTSGLSTGGVNEMHVIEGSVPDLSLEVAGCAFASRCTERLEVCETVTPALVTQGPDQGCACLRYAPEHGPS